MVIECSDQCGIAEGSEAVTMLTTRAVDAKFDAPSVMYGPGRGLAGSCGEFSWAERARQGRRLARVDAGGGRKA